MHRGTWRCAFFFLASGLFAGTPGAQVGPEVRSRLVAALELMGEGRYMEARDALQRLVTDEPEFSPAYRSFVEVSSLTEDLPAAASYFDGRLAAYPDDAYAHYGRGLVANEMGNYDLAIQSHSRAIELRPTLVEALDDRGGITRAYSGKGELDLAFHRFSVQARNEPDNAAVHYGLARVQMMRYELDDALESARRAVSLDPEMLRAQSLIVYLLSRTTPSRDLLAEIERLRVLATRAADLDMESYAEMQFGVTYQNLGDYGLSLRHANEGLRLARLWGQRGRELILLNNIATLYATAGNIEQSAKYFAEAVDHAGAAGEKDLEVIALANLGHTKRETDVDDAFRCYEQALELARAGGFKNGECLALHSLGAAEAERGNYGRASELLADALECTRQVGDRRQEGHILEQIADVAEERGELDEARTVYQQSVDVGREIDNIEILWDAEGGLASTFEKLGDKERALEHNLKAIAIYESVRASLDIDSVGTGFLNDKDEVYPSVVRLLADSGRVDEAFAYAERYKAKGLLENLARNTAFFRTLIPASMQERILDIEHRLQTTHASLADLEGPEAARDEVVAREQEIRELELEKAELNRELKESHGELHRLVRAEPLDVASVQSRVLEPDQVLIEYVVSEKNTSLFLITKDAVHYRLLPVGRDELVEMISAWSPVFGRSNTSRNATYFSPSAADFSIPDAYALYRTLIGPIESAVEEGSEIIFVPDDVLFYLPFEALVTFFDGDHRYDFDRATFLLERHAISYSSSASLLEPTSREREPAPYTLLALGNPSFDSSIDETDPSGTLDAMASYASEILRGDGLAPLPYSEEEVRSIASVVGGGSTRVATGAEASEALFKEQAPNYRILHLASHFLGNDRQPLYSRLALAPAAGSEEDGFLQVYELLGRKLSAELVVLSACNTGLGRLQKGEGLLGATRAFLYAGVPSMVVSLWSVEDRATAAIMERFYVHLKEGLEKRAALRQAKLDYLESVGGEKKDPFYWAPFILIGDWTPVSFPESRWNLRGWQLGVLLVAAAALLWRYRRANRLRR